MLFVTNNGKQVVSDDSSTTDRVPFKLPLNVVAVMTPEVELIDSSSDAILTLETVDPIVNVTPDVPVTDPSASNLRSTLSVPFPIKTSEEVSPKEIPLLEVNSKFPSESNLTVPSILLDASLFKKSSHLISLLVLQKYLFPH